MASIDLTTIGIRFGYATETTAGTRPSSFTNVSNPKDTPDMSPQPDTIDATSLNDLEFKRYLMGLKDTGGSVSFTVAMSQQTLNQWNTMCESAKTALAQGKATWFVLYHPSLNKSFFFKGEPAKLGFPSAGVNAAWDATLYIAPTGGFTWETAVNPTDYVSA
jgi:hypothetical protein